MSIHNPSRLLNKRNRLSFRKKKKLVKIIISKPHINTTINGAIKNNNIPLALNLIQDNFKIRYEKN